MASAFKCDDCGQLYEGGVENGVEVSGKGILMAEYLQLCHGCAVMRFDGLVEFEEDEDE